MSGIVSNLIIVQDAFSFHRILKNIPITPAAVFVYLLVAGSIALIVLGSRKKGKPSA